MPVTSARVAVSTTATLLADQSEAIAPMEVVLRNAGSVSVSLGGSDVAFASGYELTTGGTITLHLTTDDHALYACTSTGSGRVDVVRIQ